VVLKKMEQRAAQEAGYAYCLLADRPDFVPTLGRWFWQEWAAVYRVCPSPLRCLNSGDAHPRRSLVSTFGGGGALKDLGLHSEQEVLADMHARCLNRDKIPLTLVAYVPSGGPDGTDTPCATGARPTSESTRLVLVAWSADQLLFLLVLLLLLLLLVCRVQ
jgi:hypothetical protein